LQADYIQRPPRLSILFRESQTCSSARSEWKVFFFFFTDLIKSKCIKLQKFIGNPALVLF
jgi:hypothetical protein